MRNSPSKIDKTNNEIQKRMLNFSKDNRIFKKTGSQIQWIMQMWKFLLKGIRESAVCQQKALRI